MPGIVNGIEFWGLIELLDGCLKTWLLFAGFLRCSKAGDILFVLVLVLNVHSCEAGVKHRLVLCAY